jgi:hypothetical protein
MLKKVFILGVVITLTSFDVKDSTVYICGPQGAKKYHYSESCRGLSNCQHVVSKVTLSQAREYGLGLCGWED